MEIKPTSVKVPSVITLGPITTEEWMILHRLVVDHTTTDEHLPTGQHVYAGRDELISKLELFAFPPEAIDQPEDRVIEAMEE